MNRHTSELARELAAAREHVREAPAPADPVRNFREAGGGGRGDEGGDGGSSGSVAPVPEPQRSSGHEAERGGSGGGERGRPPRRSRRGRRWELLGKAVEAFGEAASGAEGWIFARYAIDPARAALGGFSDGASYALSLGLTNGDLFASLIAFSPGFMKPARRRNGPRFFISHSPEDRALPIDQTSRRIVPELERNGYQVRYRQFVDGHSIPAEIAREAIEWFLR